MSAELSEVASALVEKCNFSESCIDQLKTELPKFLNKKAEFDKATQSLAQTLRNVAASDSNEKIQACLFNCAAKYEELDVELKVYRQCLEQTNIILEEAKNMLITPLREILADVTETRNAVANKRQSNAVTAVNIQRLKQIETSLPVHSRMFENHRVGYMKSVLTNFLFAELRYHCKAIELISPIIESLAHVNEVDEENTNINEM